MVMIVLRFVHVVSGAIWVGMMAFMTLFLMPAVNEAGPEGGKLMVALQRRRVPVYLPILALVTIVSGLWLFQRLSGGQFGAYLATPAGLAFGLGGLAAIVGFVVGVAGARPTMTRFAKIAESLPTATPEQRPALMAEMQRLRVRGASIQKGVMVLLGLALAAMAVARYV
ncbi:MAG: hypothetical protein ACREMI_07675 [Gemmatimonadales bacterium]